jgi:8-oxo-dGTP pyrophosphatase MutT (NUDIX family)
MPADSPPALPSATILLVRDGGDGLEVFMVQRHHRIDFATGAMVFPGGKVDPDDADPALDARLAGADGHDATERSLREAAIRETFEESGVLLARPRGERALIDATRLRAIEDAHRDALNDGRRTMSEIARDEDLELAGDLLVPFAHWITPSFMPKRFDTHFFLAEAPPDHVAIHDGGESVDSVWTRPADAVAEEEAGRRIIIFPTMMNVKKLGRSPTVAEALAAARRDPIVTVFPQVEDRGGVPTMILPADAGYEITEAPVDDLR